MLWGNPALNRSSQHSLGYIMYNNVHESKSCNILERYRRKGLKLLRLSMAHQTIRSKGFFGSKDVLARNFAEMKSVPLDGLWT